MLPASVTTTTFPTVVITCDAPLAALDPPKELVHGTGVMIREATPKTTPLHIKVGAAGGATPGSGCVPGEITVAIPPTGNVPNTSLSSPILGAMTILVSVNEPVEVLSESYSVLPPYPGPTPPATIPTASLTVKSTSTCTDYKVGNCQVDAALA